MLGDKRILVVEDEPLVAMMIEDFLDELGAKTVGPAMSVEDALQLIDSHSIDAAILDVNLGEERSDGIAVRLRNEGVPFVFATGYSISDRHAFDGVEVIQKPYRRDHIAAALSRVLGATKSA